VTQFKQTVLAVLAAAGLAVLSQQSHATIKWSLGSGSCGSAFGNVCAFAGDVSGSEVRVTAWANTREENGTRYLEDAAVRTWSGGLGVANRREGEGIGQPNHAMDNYGSMDLLLFDFGDDAVTLSQVKLGGWQTDSDISLLAWTGQGTPVIDGRQYATTGEALTSNGWTLIGSYGDVAGNTDATQTVDTAASSSYWLVGAYNSVFGACLSGTCSPEDDYVKVLELSGTMAPASSSTSVPAPGTLLLLAGVLPFLRRRSREKGQAAEAI
jgi:hypothetical protein